MPDVTKGAVALHARAILVIEDEVQIRRAVKNALQDVADRIIEASTGQAGIYLAAAETPQPLIPHLGLPPIPRVNRKSALGPDAPPGIFGAAPWGRKRATCDPRR